MTRLSSRTSLTWYIMTHLVDGIKVVLGVKKSPLLDDLSKGRLGVGLYRQRGYIRRCCPPSTSSRTSSPKTSQSKTDRIMVKEAIERSSMVVEGLVQLASYTLTHNTRGLKFPSTSNIHDKRSNPGSHGNHSFNVDNPISSNPFSGQVNSSQSQGFHTNTSSSMTLNSPKNPSSQSIPLPKRQLSPSSQESRVPSSRIGRITSFGSLIAGLGVGSLAEASKRTLGLSDKTNKPLFLSDANVSRIVETLCRVRGAALKLGQIISIQDETIVSPEIAAAFERVRQSADFMPKSQMTKVLSRELGKDYKEKYFQSFNETPFAAASIGQVHEAVLKDGTPVAVKIQYPGVAEGIESDIKNLMMIIKVGNILPPGMFVDNLMKTARRELAWECDYIRESQCQDKFRRMVLPYSRYGINVPKVFPDMTTRRVFVSELVSGFPIDQLFPANGAKSSTKPTVNLSQNKRNDLATRLLRLTLQEVFEFKFVQTDPNFSNYFYDPNSDIVHLLDFGAARDYPDSFITTYFKLIDSAAHQDTEGIIKYSRDIGFLTGFESPIMEKAHVEAVQVLGEAFSSRHRSFDFGKQETTKKIAQLVPIMLRHRLTPPPEETYSLHRRMSGMFLLCARLGADIDCRSVWQEVADRYKNSLNH